MWHTATLCFPEFMMHPGRLKVFLYTRCGEKLIKTVNVMPYFLKLLFVSISPFFAKRVNQTRYKRTDFLFMGGLHVRRKDKKRHYTPANKRKTFFHLPFKSMSIRGRQRDNTVQFMILTVF